MTFMDWFNILVCLIGLIVIIGVTASFHTRNIHRRNNKDWTKDNDWTDISKMTKDEFKREYEGSWDREDKGNLGKE